MSKRSTMNGRSLSTTCWFEYRLMRKGVPYDKAHAESSRLEVRCRHHPDERHDALAAEGWS